MQERLGGKGGAKQNRPTQTLLANPYRFRGAWPSLFLEAERGVVEANLEHHLVQSVGDAHAVSLADFLGPEVGGGEREELRFVAFGQQVDDRVERVAVVEHLDGFRAQVVDAEHVFLGQIEEGSVVGLAQVGDVFGIDDVQAIPWVAGVLWIRMGDAHATEQLLEGFHHGALAIAARAAEDDAKLRAAVCEPPGQFRDFRLYLVVHDEGAVPELHLCLNCGGEGGDSVLEGEWHLKTHTHSPLPKQATLQRLYVERTSLVDYFHR